MTTMKSAIEKILAAHDQLEPFHANKHYAVKIANEPFMPLSIEKHDDRITVTHYYESNGDLVPDPDVEFAEIGGDDWLPVAIQHASGLYCVAAQRADGTGNWLVSKRAMADLKSFVRMWARNLIAQGFAKGKIARVEPG